MVIKVTQRTLAFVVLEVFCILTVMVDTQACICDKLHRINTHISISKTGRHLSKISRLYHCLYLDCHVTLWFYKILPLGEMGKGYMGSLCIISSNFI